MTEFHARQTIVGGIMLTIAGFLFLSAGVYAQRREGWKYVATVVALVVSNLFIAWLLSGGLT